MSCDASSVSFCVPDPDHVLAGVRLWQEVRLPGNLLAFSRLDGAWRLTLPRPGVDRMEYLFELRHHDGRVETVVDSGNPLRAGGAFGDHSVVQFPGYVPPAWLAVDAPPGSIEDMVVRSKAVGADVHVRLWSSAGLRTGAPAPLLVVHDGPEYDALASLTGYLAAMVRSFDVAPLRAALLSPGPRDEWYSAEPRYARALCTEVLPTVDAHAPATSWIGMGASLGGLAVLHAHRTYAGWFDGLFLQSASFFHPAHDAHESRFARYPAITAFVSGMLGAQKDPWPVPVTVTCGSIEENVENNRLLTATLARLGYDVAKHEVPDVHNYTAWRDAFHPYLTTLLRKAVAA
jgi:enterochelin esterase family protein